MHIETHTFILQILLLLSSAAVVVTLFYRLNIPSLLGFILAGMALGPTGIRIIQDADAWYSIAQMGLVFLLFLLGLEFSMPRLLALRHIVLKLGTAQVCLCTLAFWLAFTAWGLPTSTALFIASALSLSSTAIVSKELSHTGQLHERHGQIAIGILLFQDLIAILLITAIPFLSDNHASSLDIHKSILFILLTFAKTISLWLGFLWAGRYLLPAVLTTVVRVHADELLVLIALVIVLAAGYITASIGFSMELGAFLAGMMLGESRFRHQLEANIRPFRDVLLGLFFISVGMLVNIPFVMQYWLRILVAGFSLFIFKTIIISSTTRFLKESWSVALATGVALGQGGEFLFALLVLATRDGFIAHDVAAFLIAVVLVSMIITPPIIKLSQSWIQRFLEPKQTIQPEAHYLIAQYKNTTLNNHVIILGFGRVGKTIARFLSELNMPYLALDKDIIRISEAHANKQPVFYGDPTQSDILKSSGIDRAALLVISFDHPTLAQKILHQVREMRPDLPILARARDDSISHHLLAAGASEVVPETLEASFMLVFHVLLLLNVPTEEIHQLIKKARSDRYRML